MYATKQVRVVCSPTNNLSKLRVRVVCSPTNNLSKFAVSRVKLNGPGSASGRGERRAGTLPCSTSARARGARATMPSESEDISPSVSMLSEVSGMDNSLSLAEIDRIISNLIGKEAEHNLELGPDEHQSFVSEIGALDDANGARGAVLVPESPNMANVSMNFEDIPSVQASPLVPRESVLSPAVQRLLPQSSLGLPTAGAYAHDSPTDIPSYVSPPPAPTGGPCETRGSEVYRQRLVHRVSPLLPCPQMRTNVREPDRLCACAQGKG